MSRMLARKPIYKFRHSISTTNITLAAWVQVLASMPVAVGAMEIFNSSGQILKLSLGAAGVEDASEINYYVLPNGSPILIPIEVSKGKRLSAKAVDGNAAVGDLIFNFFA
jgi:hypothetical protein